MSKRPYAIGLMVSLLILASSALTGQSSTTTPPTPVVVSGEDLGFRIDRYDGSRPVGTLVVRVNGRWVEPKATMQPVPLGSR